MLGGASVTSRISHWKACQIQQQTYFSITPYAINFCASAFCSPNTNTFRSSDLAQWSGSRQKCRDLGQSRFCKFWVGFGLTFIQLPRQQLKQPWPSHCRWYLLQARWQPARWPCFAIWSGHGVMDGAWRRLVVVFLGLCVPHDLSVSISRHGLRFSVKVCFSTESCKATKFPTCKQEKTCVDTCSTQALRNRKWSDAAKLTALYWFACPAQHLLPQCKKINCSFKVVLGLPPSPSSLLGVVPPCLHLCRETCYHGGQRDDFTQDMANRCHDVQGSFGWQHLLEHLGCEKIQATRVSA